MDSVHNKKRKVAFPESSALPPADTPESWYGDEVVAQVPLYNPTATPLDRLYRHIKHIPAPTSTRAPVATVYNPDMAPQAPKVLAPTLKQEAPRMLPTSMTEYGRTQYQKYLEYAEPPNVYLTDFEAVKYSDNRTKV